MYRAQQIHIKKGHRFYAYCEDLCRKANYLYNVTNFYIRQLFSGLPKEENERHTLEQEAIDFIYRHLPALNQIQIDYVQKRRRKEATKPEEERKQIPDANLYAMPTLEKPFLPYGLLEGILKLTKHPDYIALPGQVNQKVMRKVYDNWTSFFASLKAYKANPEAFTGRPRIPKYKKKNGVTAVFFSNQVCKVKQEKYLQFPKTSQRLNLGKLGMRIKNLQEVRIIPSYGAYTIEMVCKQEETPSLSEKPTRILGIDLGVNNAATLANNIGQPPVIVKGGVVKSINQFYNKQRAYYTAILRKGKQPNEGPFHSKRLLRLDQKRQRKIKDFLHKASFRIIEQAKAWKIDTIVIGKSKGWKNEVPMRKGAKQTFAFLPFESFIQMLTYKGEQAGIRVLTTEESYTSQADFLANDPLPVYGEFTAAPLFSGKRIARGLYQSGTGIVWNADVNAAYNIIRKAVSDAFRGGNRGVVCVSTPLVVKVR
ncbi:RNA-guided endonuclease InsQ/TnpB family protein [Aneurinibacillus danicus]|uniref:Uncharacterized protein n=1 Tax=Aneurinibacillus danicus TaxID=267746 RepID=A0A511V9I3_9BACL|nr:RNA-guided endonuclease TnpB family protein [Aneurinibacillus danicus]GEN34538.1 hypothetical protein ADA01nite_19980 [Aneurinibacillus danicus]